MTETTKRENIKSQTNKWTSEGNNKEIYEF